LSGGQKQRLVLAGILAMQPRYLVLDEPTSMLDAQSRQEFINVIARLSAAGHGILHITHDLELAASADQAIVLSDGQKVYHGDPLLLLADQDNLLNWKLQVPFDKSVGGDKGRLTADGLFQKDRLELRDISFSYPGDFVEAVSVLDGLSLSMNPGSYTLISGVSGAGKSTLLRTAAGLLKPDHGLVGIIESDQVVAVRPGQVGLVFQHPEDQLFAPTVAEDVVFGPLNLGLITEKTDEGVVARSLQAVGLDPEVFAKRSPFMLSGGEMRRVAIAGVLAMQPRWLLFDEPTAGIDAEGRAFIHRLINDQLSMGTAVLVVSHSVEEFADRVDMHYRLEAGRLWPS
jgi:energy-coupling factor transport system ATP-binding protein